MNSSIRLNTHNLIAFVDSHIINYPTSINLNYRWSFGSCAGICLIIQIITGIFLAMHYVPDINFAFNSVEHIMRDVNNGWFIRYGHANGASMFFIVFYVHLFRGLYYGSYIGVRSWLWCSGVVIFLLLMATAFLGYVLPWGQMSFWGATVITNLFSAIPLVGSSIVEWLWGGFSVGKPTLNRFFSLHFFLPFIISGLSLLHLALLHKDGSSNPIGSNKNLDTIPFYPYFYVKDLLSFFIFLFFYLLLIFFYPNLLGHPDNYILANSLVTPAHIVPEWYFLPFYAILRSNPTKLGGVLMMIMSIVILFFLPILNTSEIQSSKFRSIYSSMFWQVLVIFIVLGWIGQKPVEEPYIEIGQYSASFYFIFFTLFVPLIGKLESALLNYKN